MAVLLIHLNTFYSIGSWDAECTLSKGTHPLIECASLHIQFTQMSLREGRLNTEEFTLSLMTSSNFFEYIHFTPSSNSMHVLKKILSLYTKLHVNQSFNVLLTVYHEMILGNCPTWCTNSFQCIYLFIVLYIFRAWHARNM